MRKFFGVLLAVLFVGSVAQAQQFSNILVTKVSTSHHTVGTATADAILAAAIGGNLMSFKVCNDAVNTSTYLLVGTAVDVSTDGVMLDKGACFECINCKPIVLKSMRVEGQAASNGYSIIQYRN